jgi:hypothetical protein
VFLEFVECEAGFKGPEVLMCEWSTWGADGGRRGPGVRVEHLCQGRGGLVGMMVQPSNQQQNGQSPKAGKRTQPSTVPETTFRMRKGVDSAAIA